jgi:hypothetical protein
MSFWTSLWMNSYETWHEYHATRGLPTVASFNFVPLIVMALSVSAGVRAGLSRFKISILGGGWEFFSSPPCPDRLWGSPNLLSNTYQGSFLGAKRPGREADHSPPSSAEVKKRVELYLHSPIRLHCLVLCQINPVTTLPFTISSNKVDILWKRY